MEDLDRYIVTLDEQGRLVLPAQLRERLSLQPGDRLVITAETDGRPRAMSSRVLARKFRGLFSDIPGEVSIVDELITERREEARRETEDE